MKSAFYATKIDHKKPLEEKQTTSNFFLTITVAALKNIKEGSITYRRKAALISESYSCVGCFLGAPVPTCPVWLMTNW